MYWISAKFWIIAFNRALEIINTGTTKGFDFADDICALAGGTDIKASVDSLQHKINLLTKWGSSCGLTFSPAKSILYTENLNCPVHRICILQSS